MEILSEQKCTDKMVSQIKNRAQSLDNCSVALKFTLEKCNVQIKNKPSAEQLVDQDEKAILGLIWSIMVTNF